ncbi:ABC transporter permease [Lysinibacillus sphaericus]|uniref:ABC transporter permease n=1 Tax=Lysinibacillus sphaericus TaxID=1421 RepID=A0A2S0K1S4_LYSSH|nr:ABC transporter permease [Lysinibacillus sphaericus]AVK97249.1 ABC transporter permease [Lysinibacillus sphaericus]MED4542550.1 ABC transporter permease [Lysinibacillus sphaericus]TKI20063.1 ABC transporter permease [Lysinibacillus sphaericus]SUV16861.1 oligopeptide ABC transporter membrane protein [Lysinibacillus sphaericus]GEC80334.1 oligopeptidepermease [Lysinibacillus sphaericus]
MSMYTEEIDHISDKSRAQLFDFVEATDGQAEDTAYSNYSYWRSTWKSFLKNRVAVFLLVMVCIIVAFTIFQPYLPAQKSPTEIYLDDQTGLQARNIAPNAEFWFGTNSIGQDLWSRIWAGTRTSLMIGCVVALVEAFIGITIGTLWGFSRKLEMPITQLYNVVDNIPTTIVLILMSYILRPSISTIIIAMCITGWVEMARFIRNQIVILRDREYNLASKCLGTSDYRIIVKNLLPYLISVIMLRMSLAIPFAIGAEVFLTYIGLGLPISEPSLGNLINEGRVLMMSPDFRYQLIFPSIVLSIITIAFYIIGNAFADAADPKNHV